MYFTHHFSSNETLTRALSWLTALGFAPERMEIHSEGIPRLSLAVDPLEWASVEMLLNVVERSDPEGWPSFHELAKKLAHTHVEAVPSAEPAIGHESHRTAIGWHPADPSRGVAADDLSWRGTFH